MQIRIIRLIPKHLRDSLIRTVHKHEEKLTDTFQTISHFGILLLAFIFVVLLFMWKEGRLNKSAVTPSHRSFDLSTPYPTTALKEVPRADVGMRMLIDQGNGELGTDTARLASPSATSINRSDKAVSSYEFPQLDLQGPWSCATATSGGAMSLYIHDNKIHMTDQTTSEAEHMLFNGDCLYIWKSSTGTKQCGLREYLTLFSTLLSGSEGIDIGSIIQEQVGSDPARSQSYESLRRSCRKMPVSDSVFSLPQTVQWKESSASDQNSLNFGQ